jgi:hypothetical protein
MRSLLALSALALLGLLAAPGTVQASGVIMDAGCNQLGATQMADNHTAILLCAFPAASAATAAATSCGSPSGCQWKAMSGAAVTPTGLYGYWTATRGSIIPGSCGVAEYPAFIDMNTLLGCTCIPGYTQVISGRRYGADNEGNWTEDLWGTCMKN